MIEVWIVAESVYGDGAPGLHAFRSRAGAVAAMKRVLAENVETSGQDRESYADEQDRESYTVEDEDMAEALAAEVDALPAEGGTVRVGEDYMVTLSVLTVED